MDGLTWGLMTGQSLLWLPQVGCHVSRWESLAEVNKEGEMQRQSMFGATVHAIGAWTSEPNLVWVCQIINFHSFLHIYIYVYKLLYFGWFPPWKAIWKKAGHMYWQTMTILRNAAWHVHWHNVLTLIQASSLVCVLTHHLRHHRSSRPRTALDCVLMSLLA